MKVLVIIEVDKEVLQEQNTDIEKEIEKFEFPGVEVERCLEISDSGVETEYAAFGLDVDRQEYVKLGRPVHSEQLCKNRLKEASEKGWIAESVDQSNICFRKREVVICSEEWKAFAEEV